MAWSAGAPFAAAIGVSTGAGEAMIRDALTLRHRLPLVWARLLAGDLVVWRARRIAQAVWSRPADVAAWIDETIAPLAHKVGSVTLGRLLEEAMLRLYPEERQLDQLEALDARHATLDTSSIGHTGVAEMTLRGDWKDLSDFDATLAESRPRWRFSTRPRSVLRSRWTCAGPGRWGSWPTPHRRRPCWPTPPTPPVAPAPDRGRGAG